MGCLSMSKKHKKHIATPALPQQKPSFVAIQPCHVGPIEIVPNLFLGSMKEALKMPGRGVTTLIPLYELDGSIWTTGFRGEILYYPTSDYSVLPDDVLNSLVNNIIQRLANNVKVGLFCMGGHGRTGYVAAVVLGRMGYADPIAFLREHYCEGAVESNKQVEHIAKVLEMPELEAKYVTKYMSYYSKLSAYAWSDHEDEDTQSLYERMFSESYLENRAKSEKQPMVYCKDCAMFNTCERCVLFGVRVNPYDAICEDAVAKADR